MPACSGDAFAKKDTLRNPEYVWFFPSRVKARLFDVWQWLVFCRMTWVAAACPNLHGLRGGHVASTMARFVVPFLLSSPGPTLAMNAVLSFAITYKYAILFAKLDEAEQKLASTYHGEIPVIAASEFLLVGFTWLVSNVVQGWTRSMERSKLEAKAASRSEAPIKSLQTVLCDAVVSVDENLVLTNPSSQLGHYLLRYPPNNSYEGTSLLNFVDEPDRERVKEQIQSVTPGPGSSILVVAKVIDGNQSALNVQMYCVAFLDVDDCLGYCIGIREVKGDAAGPGRADSLDASSGVGIPDVRRTLPSVSESGYESANDSDASSVVPLVTSTGAFEATIDVTNTHLPIMSASASMTQLVGPLCSAEDSFLDWIAEDMRADLVLRISDAIDRHAAAGHSSPGMESLGRVRLQPRHALRAGLQYIANVSIDIGKAKKASSRAGASTGNAVCLPVVFRFSEIGLKKLAKRRKRPDSLARPMLPAAMAPGVAGGFPSSPVRSSPVGLPANVDSGISL
eukprot:TRINITY_DN47713_c0_g1_i2.p1 TRINITY_DN47713_c0_g1~~TRINITY_DN47713_c0_g1_i2.p1  ORF type:complete len:524 (+),score=81.23 TRINITY_DN47713_c0_g1_i2:45-1574(+)